ncbi:MAG: hypothetical protein PHQ27_00020 [Victivallales bacterium]|nr:hypothetical protein [Victivallales bacterium]
MLLLLLEVMLRILVWAGCLWGGMKLTKLQGDFLSLLIIAIIATLSSFIPLVGTLISTVVMLILIWRWLGCRFWPDAVLMVVVAKIIGIALAMVLLLVRRG